MYKDKAKQREAAKKALEKFRAKSKGISVIPDEIPACEIPEQPQDEIPLIWHTPPDVVDRLTKTGTVVYDGQSRPASWQGKNGYGQLITLNLGPYKSAGELAGDEFNRVSVPGDSDYEGPYTRAPANIG